MANEGYHALLKLRALSALIAAAVTMLPPVSALAAEVPPLAVGQYFLSDDGIDLAGGALLKADCTQDGSMIGAIPVRGDPETRAVVKLIATHWVNDPDPTLAPYSDWPVPDVLQEMPRLFLCYDMVSITGQPLPFDEFCDWAPRGLKQTLEADHDGDGVRDLLISVIYYGGSQLCAAD